MCKISLIQIILKLVLSWDKDPLNWSINESAQWVRNILKIMLWNFYDKKVMQIWKIQHKSENELDKQGFMPNWLKIIFILMIILYQWIHMCYKTSVFKLFKWNFQCNSNTFIQEHIQPEIDLMAAILFRFQSINPMRPSDAYMCQ